MALIHIKPIEGRQPVFPGTRTPVPAEGCDVEISTYWLRRERDGDLTISEPQESAAEKRGKAARKNEESNQ